MSHRAMEKARQRAERRSEVAVRRLQQASRRVLVERRDYSGPDEDDIADD